MNTDPGPVPGRAPRLPLRVTVAAAIAAVMCLGALATARNHALPVVRNALLYAQTAESLSAARMQLWKVCPEADLAFNKPCGFSAIAAPFVGVLGMNGAVKAASFLGTALFVLVAAAFFRRFNPRLGLGEEAVPLQMAICCLNPLVVYQFWSGYPDALYAAGFVACVVVLDLVLDPNVRPTWVAAYLPLLLASIVVKHAAPLMLLLHALFLVWRRRDVVQLWRRRPVVVVVAGVSMLLAAGFFVLGTVGLNPLMNLTPETLARTAARDPDGYGRARLAMFAVSMVSFVSFLLLTVGVFSGAVPFARLGRGHGHLVAVPVVYVVLLAQYFGTQYNLRYYLPVLPFIALLGGAGFARLRRPPLRRAMAVGFAVCSVLAGVFFNEPVANRAVARALGSEDDGPLVSPHPARYSLAEFEQFDNLRMTAHLSTAKDIRLINEQLSPGLPLIYVTNYYTHGGMGVYERSGMFRDDIRISYVSSAADLAPLATSGGGGSASALPEGALVYFQGPELPTPTREMAPLAPRVYRITSATGAAR